MDFVAIHHELISQILSDLKREFREKKSISRTTFGELESVFHGQLQSALAIIDRRRVKKVTCTKGRVVFQIVGATREVYTCLPTSNFCCCYSYLHQVIRKQEVPMCKHVLAARLAEALGIYDSVQCSDETLALMLKSMMSS
ncbi:zinc finger SWIM domain-containing protein 7-like [Ornithodoros turicata]|uniref:zinc finger SWIM domain-containing protein 7-like n=1 Tax=Ornithodoros turicata TaxID=34597 RepID=UPI00313997B0